MKLRSIRRRAIARNLNTGDRRPLGKPTMRRAALFFNGIELGIATDVWITPTRPPSPQEVALSEIAAQLRKCMSITIQI